MTTSKPHLVSRIVVLSVVVGGVAGYRLKRKVERAKRSTKKGPPQGTPSLSSSGPESPLRLLGGRGCRAPVRLGSVEL